METKPVELLINELNFISRLSSNINSRNMNKIRTLLGGVLGTSTMTLFSYAVAQKRDKEFEEPVLLHELFQRALLRFSGKRHEQDDRFDGWLLHYIAGFLFSSAYDRIWKETKAAPTIASGMILGAISGLAGIAIWNLTFKMHPDPPNVDTKEYYKHLMAAHIIFGMFAALGYRIPESVGLENEEELELDV